MATSSGLLVSMSQSVHVNPVLFPVSCFPNHERPFVVVELGHENVRLHAWEVATLDALAAAVADARDQLAAVLAGQATLPIESAAAVPA